MELDTETTDRRQHIGTSNAAGPRKYMSKRQSACDACRVRKSACQIETAPPCRLCLAHNKPCTFTGRKRKAPQLWGQPTSVTASPRVPGSQLDNIHSPPRDSHSFSQTIANKHALSPITLQVEDHDWNDLFFAANGAQSQVDLNLEMDPEFSPGVQEDSTVTRLDEQDHLGQATENVNMDFWDELFKASPQPQIKERSLDNLSDITAQLCGLTGDMDPYMLRRYRYNDNGEFAFSRLSLRTTQDTSTPVQFLLSPRDLSADSTLEAELDGGNTPVTPSGREALSRLIPPEIGSRLIRLFFRFIAIQFPILSQANPPDAASAPVHLLAAIYCTTQPFATYDDRLCVDFAYKAPSSQMLYNIAWKSLNRSFHAPNLETVQSALLLLLQPPTNELVLDSAFKWALLGTIVSTAQTIGLHLDASFWKLPKNEVLLRKRLSWAVYSFDKWLALSLGRPSHINTNNWLVSKLEQCDLEDDDLAVDTSICLQFSQLTTILDRVLTDLYSLGAVGTLTQDYKTTLAKSRELLKDLTSWYQGLDPSFHARTSETLSSNSEPDSRVSIHLCYHAVKITILRALLRPFYHADARPPRAPEENASWLSARNHCRLGAKIGADDALRTASSMRACHYQAFWAPWCRTHFALITNLLCLLSITSAPDESPAASAALNQARRIYRVQARSFSVIRFALLRIDSLFWVGFEELINKEADESSIVT